MRSATSNECLICLQKQIEFWTPDTACPCRPCLHPDCWDTWRDRTGDAVCIICRQGTRRNQQQVQLQPAVVIVLTHQVTADTFCRSLCILIGLLFVCYKLGLCLYVPV